MLKLTAAGIAAGVAAHSGAATPAAGGTGSPAVIGVVTYRIDPAGALDGVWSIPDYAGRTGTERASGGIPGQLAGTYRVEIHDPDRHPIFSGTLELSQERETWRLVWTGSDGSRYLGIGLQPSSESLCAAYWGPVT